MDGQHRHRHRHRHRHEEDLTGGRAAAGARRGGASATEASRRGRFHHRHDAAGSVPVVDQAECCTAQACRSCVGVTLADAIAVGCCPCAVVTLLALALVRAPLAVARRCLRRLRRRRYRKRVRDDMGPAAAAKAKCRRSDAGEALDADAASKCAWGLEMGGRGEAGASSSSSSAAAAASGRLDEEKVWMEMYQVGQWGFGRLSISVSPPRPPPPVRPGRSPDRDGEGEGDSGREDADLQCES